MTYPIPRTSQDLDRLVSDATEEGLHIEFKSKRVLLKKDQFKRDFPKFASAFANAAGGVIVIGVEEKEGVATEVAGASREECSPEWLENVLLPAVKPAIAGIEFLRVGHPTGDVFVVVVPESTLAPHQAIDGRCYARRQRRIDPLELFEIDLLRLRASSADHLVFGGVVVEGFWVSAVVENKRNTPIFDVSLKLADPVREVLQKPPRLVGSGITVFPPRTTLSFRLALVREFFSHPVLAAGFDYQFSCKEDPAGKSISMAGRVDLAQLSDAAYPEQDVDRLISTLKVGFRELSGALRK